MSPKLMGFIFFFAAAASLIAVLGVFHPRQQTSAAPIPQSDGSSQPVLVELFTSEGCSSCPPADALLKRLTETQPVAGVQIIALEEHVDYWNRLGWADPFSATAYSVRQDEYASSFGSGSVYTPQMVVDGQFEFVGSRGDQARHTIQKSATRPKLELSASLKPGSTAEKPVLQLQVSNPRGVPLDGAAELWLAITETNLQSDVKAGENSGELLTHAAVVRSLRKIETLRDASRYKRELNVDADPKWKRENLSAVVFLSEKDSRRVIGVAAAPLHP
jgi:hypothetical protein